MCRKPSQIIDLKIMVGEIYSRIPPQTFEATSPRLCPPESLARQLEELLDEARPGCVYIYIYREREIYIYTYIHTYK